MESIDSIESRESQENSRICNIPIESDGFYRILQNSPGRFFLMIATGTGFHSFSINPFVFCFNIATKYVC